MAAAGPLGADAAYRALRQRVDGDPNVVGFFLGGSRGKGFATPHSDYDCYVIVRDEDDGRYAAELAPFSPPLDMHVRSLSWLRDPRPGWDRYNYAYLTVDVDRLGGEVQRLVDERAALAQEEAASAATWSLPAYTNAVYRSLKSARDGRSLEARLDAAESVNYFLTALFSIHGRVRPYNKYLRWEIERHPIEGLPWTADELLREIEEVVKTARPETQRALFRRLELQARERGFANAFEEWRPEQLEFVRGMP